MILTFKKQFVKPIIDGVKIHTIREDKKNRWKSGNIIHFATDVRTKKQKQFKEGICLSVQKIKIYYFGDFPSIRIDGKMLSIHEMLLLIKNDGLYYKDFVEWFNKDFTGKLIHWTKKIY